MEKQFARSLFYEILRIRLVEEEVARRYPEKQMRCPVHLSVGQEAPAVALAQALSPQDYMVSTHRAHAHYLAKGGDLKAFISELYGKATGCSKGQGGSMHLIDLKANFLGSTSIVGGTIPVGVGAAFGHYLKGERKLTAICIGDTAVEEGVFHEAMNFASLHKLPVLFYCENNGYSCFSPLQNRQPDRPLQDVAVAHGIPSAKIDGNNVFTIYQALIPWIERIQQGVGPVFLEIPTYRYLEHCGPFNDDNLGYRPQEEIDFWTQKDAIRLARQTLQSLNFWEEAWEQEQISQINTEIKLAFEFALEAPFPTPDQLGAFIYAK